MKGLHLLCILNELSHSAKGTIYDFFCILIFGTKTVELNLSTNLYISYILNSFCILVQPHGAEYFWCWFNTCES